MNEVEDIERRYEYGEMSAVDALNKLRVLRNAVVPTIDTYIDETEHLFQSTPNPLGSIAFVFDEAMEALLRSYGKEMWLHATKMKRDLLDD